MREIKFRAWLTLSDYDDDGNDKDYHGMATRISVHHGGDIGFSVEEGHHIFGGDIFERALDNGTVSEYEEWCLWEGQFHLMQFTGLLDKNGVEIYEGDILRYVPLPEHDDGSPSIDTYEVIWRGMGWCGHWLQSQPKSDSRYSVGHLTDSHKDLEVVGNIYENPELLKGQLT